MRKLLLSRELNSKAIFSAFGSKITLPNGSLLDGVFIEKEVSNADFTDFRKRKIFHLQILETETGRISRKDIIECGGKKFIILSWTTDEDGWADVTIQRVFDAVS